MFRKINLFCKSHYLAILLFTGIYFLFITNSFHERYPDEFDNIFGGYLINHGIFPYTGFFSHHGPVSYYLASILTIFSGQSFVLFRFLTTILYLLFLLSALFIFRRRIETMKITFFLLYAFILAVSSTYFWGHMFLADPISGYLLIPAYGIFFLKMYINKKLESADLVIISIFSFLAVLNSLTYIYAVFIITAMSSVYFLTKNRITLKNISIFVLLFLAPYLFFILYLFLTNSLEDYYFQAIIYNKNHYVYNYPRPPGSTALNPIRYAIVIFNNFINAYQPLLAGIKDFTLMNPFNVTLALSNLLLWIFLLIKRKYLLFIFTFLIIVYVNIRSNPITSRVTDYQSAVYIMLTFFNASFLVFILKDELGLIKNYLARMFLTVLTVLFIVYWFFNLLFVSTELWRMTYNRYMGQTPLIYDKPQVAQIINEVVPKDRYCWVGPFSFEELLYLKCKLPSRYHWILPQFAGIEKIKSELLKDHARNKADIIVYKRRFETFGATSAFGKFFTDFLDENYVRLKDNNSYKKYHFKNSETLDFSLDEDFNFEKIKAEELINLLVKKGYIEEKKE